MLTGRRVLFGTAPCVAPKAQGMVSSLRITFPAPISFSHFFDGWKQTGRRGSRVKGARLLCVHRSAAQTLDSAPAPRTIPPSGKKGRSLAGVAVASAASKPSSAQTLRPSGHGSPMESADPVESTCLRDCRPRRFCRLRTKTGRAREKSKSLPRNKFTHVNARAASGIPAAPVWG